MEFDLPVDVHPGVIARREWRTRIQAEGAEAERTALAVRHRQEWDDHLDLWNDALLKRSIPLAMLAKELAQTLKIRQAEERRAWKDEGASTPLSPAENLARIHELLKLLNISTENGR